MARTNLASGFAGFLLGVVTGCAICAAAADSPGPFVDKVQKVTADVDPSQKLAGGIDPNRALNEQQEKNSEEADPSGIKTVTIAQSPETQSSAPAPKTDGSYWLQAGAFKEEQSARDLTGSLALTGISNVQVVKAGNVWRVRIGPFADKQEASEVQNQIGNLGFQTSVVR